jgi:hypothetical protein
VFRLRDICYRNDCFILGKKKEIKKAISVVLGKAESRMPKILLIGIGTPPLLCVASVYGRAGLPLAAERTTTIATSHIFLNSDNKIPLHILGNG